MTSAGVEDRGTILVSCPERMVPSVWDKQATTRIGMVRRRGGSAKLMDGGMSNYETITKWYVELQALIV